MINMTLCHLNINGMKYAQDQPNNKKEMNG